MANKREEFGKNTCKTVMSTKSEFCNTIPVLARTKAMLWNDVGHVRCSRAQFVSDAEKSL